LLEVDLVPAHCHQLTHSKAVAVGEKDQRGIPMTVSANSAALMSLSTSSGVRCSRERRLRFATRRGGVTFPFSGVGLGPPTAGIVAGDSADNV